MATHAKRYTLMPIPAIDPHTSYFEAGPIVVGVEYRLLTDAIVGQHVERQGHEGLGSAFDDRGVSLHVFVLTHDGKREERLRFDCFDEDPHYHYVDWQAGTNDIVHIDPVADGDPLAWSLDRVRTRLPQMLARAGVADSSVDAKALEETLPRIAEAAYRARYQNDDGAGDGVILAGAMTG